MKTMAIIQARMASSRLPGKVLADIIDKPMLYHVVYRAQQVPSLSLVAVATSAGLADDAVACFCAESNIPCFRGSEYDVLDRYYHAARHFDADIVVRLTADCPLLDPLVIDKVVQTFREGDFDYVSNFLECTYPDGLDTEVFWRPVLEQAWAEARLRSEREHVTSYIHRNPEIFRLGNVRNGENLSALRWTVDEPEDLEFVRAVYGYLKSIPSFGMVDILALLHKHPELNKINARFMRNEGYTKSVREDLSLTGKDGN